MGKNGMTQRFRGSYDVKIDDRGRVKIPAKFLQVFDSGFGREIYITSLNGDHVMMYPMQVWEEMEKKIENVGVWNPDINDFVSRLSYWGTESEIDLKGRILIPPVLRKASQLDGVSRILGKANNLEIWNEEIFKTRELGDRFGKEKLHEVSKILNAVISLPSDEQ
jgi:MraZ protein